MSSAESRVAQEVERSLKQLTSVFRSEEQRLKQVQTDLEKQAADLARQAELLEEEKLRMTAVGVADNDVLELNVGGQQFAMKRGTLTQVEGSVLSAMFSGRWEQSLDHDSQGHIFLDLDPYCFERIITYLRSRSRDMALGLDTAEPMIECSKQHIYTQLIDYLGLTSVMKGTGAALTENAHEPFFLVSWEFQVVNAVVDGAWSRMAIAEHRCGQLIIDAPLTSGSVHFRKIKLHQLEAVFAGISGPESVTSGQEQVSSQTRLYGWGTKEFSGVWIDGQCTQQPLDGFVALLQSTLLFKIDLVKGELACMAVAADTSPELNAYARMTIAKTFAHPIHVYIDVKPHIVHKSVWGKYPSSVQTLSVSEAEKLLFDRAEVFAK